MLISLCWFFRLASHRAKHMMLSYDLGDFCYAQDNDEHPLNSIFTPLDGFSWQSGPTNPQLCSSETNLYPLSLDILVLAVWIYSLLVFGFFCHRIFWVAGWICPSLLDLVFQLFFLLDKSFLVFGGELALFFIASHLQSILVQQHIYNFFFSD